MVAIPLLLPGESGKTENKKEMFTHEPENYQCPFCLFLQGNERGVPTKQDVVYQNVIVTVFISPRWWPNNPGHVIIIPNIHVENIYDLPRAEAHAIQDTAQLLALALKHTYHCHGISTRQHNEPAGGQDVWHYHLHVFPRYEQDDLYRLRPLQEFVSAEQRLVYAERLRTYLKNQ
jgi:histidine triad (HIT) family protein